MIHLRVNCIEDLDELFLIVLDHHPEKLSVNNDKLGMDYVVFFQCLLDQTLPTQRGLP